MPRRSASAGRPHDASTSPRSRSSASSGTRPKHTCRASARAPTSGRSSKPPSRSQRHRGDDAPRNQRPRSGRPGRHKLVGLPGDRKLVELPSPQGRHDVTDRESNRPDERLHAIAGRWDTSGHVIGDPKIPVVGTDTYEVLAGGDFVVHHVDVTVGEQPVRRFTTASPAPSPICSVSAAASCSPSSGCRSHGRQRCSSVPQPVPKDLSPTSHEP
jgi:hypothetical protein